MEYKCVYGRKEVRTERIPFNNEDEFLPSTQEGIKGNKI
jgi:hypothetical protein